MDNNQATLGGPLFLLFLLFLGLKLTGYIAWSWWWVTAPLWGGFVLLFTLFVVLAIIAAAPSR